jgi:hypothetical protein
VRELHRTSRLLEDLARVAVPVLIRRELNCTTYDSNLDR